LGLVATRSELVELASACLVLTLDLRETQTGLKPVLQGAYAKSALPN
jgi:hypothetical protein